MYNEDISNSVIDDLESKIINVVDTAVTLASQGMVTNKDYSIKLDWTALILNSFENIQIFTKEQQIKLERIYNKLFMI